MLFAHCYTQFCKIRKFTGHFYRATHMYSANYAVARCLSVRLSHAGIESKRLHISSKFFHLGTRVAPPL